MNDQSFNDLLARLESGEEDAASKVFRKFAAQLIAKARSRLNPGVRAKVDPEDVVQSVYRSFFRRLGEGEFQFDSWEGLWGLLLTITLRKCHRQHVRFHSDKRDIRREVPPASDQGPVDWRSFDRQPSPEESVAMNETLDHLMRVCRPQQRDILVYALQGYSQREISQYTGCSERTVRRVLKFVRDDLAELGRAEDRMDDA